MNIVPSDEAGLTGKAAAIVSSGKTLQGAAIFVAALNLFAFLSLAFSLWDYTVDDSFITLRYAENASRGFGLVYNQGPPRAEGYTSILWTSILVAPHFLGLNSVVFSKVCGLAFTILAASIAGFSVFKASDGDDRSSKFVAAAGAWALFLSFPHAPVHSVSGMETALAAALYSVVGAAFIPLCANVAETLPLC